MFKALLKTVVFWLFRIKVDGKFELSLEKNLIIANHQSLLDGLILGLVLPIKPVFVVNTEVAKRPIMRLFLSLSEYLAIDPSNPMATKSIVKLIESGRVVVIFPEGRITTTGSLMKIYEGSAFVAAKTGALVTTIIISGSHFSALSRMHNAHPKRWFPKLRVSICTPTTVSVPDESRGAESRAFAGEKMREILQNALYRSRQSQTLYKAFLEAKELYGARKKIVEDAKFVEYDYRGLFKISLALGRLVERKSVPNEAVGVMMPTAIASLGLFFGLGIFGRIPAMLNFTAGAASLQSACIAAQIKIIVTARAFVEQAKLDEKLAALSGVEILYLEDLKNEMSIVDKLWVLYSLFCPPKNSQKPQDAAVILFTSGSEGEPKGVVLSHNALLANIAQIRTVVDISTEDKVLNAMPMFHSFGLTAGTLMPILGGVELFMYPSPLHYRVIPEIAYDRSCTILFGTNTFLSNYAKNAHPYDFYKMRLVVAGAEKLSQSVKELWFEKFGLRIYEGYGATETAPVIAVNTPMAYRSATVGRMLPGLEHKLVKVDGIEDGGVLFVKGDNVMSGYFRAANGGVLEKTTSELGDGWYNTGDVVTIDKDGFLRIVGRMKRFAKIAGEMVSLESAERLAVIASPLHLHAVVAIADESRGEALVLFSTDETLSKDMLQASAKESKTTELAVAKKIVFIPALPLLGTGKIDYLTLTKMAK